MIVNNSQSLVSHAKLTRRSWLMALLLLTIASAIWIAMKEEDEPLGADLAISQSANNVPSRLNNKVQSLSVEQPAQFNEADLNPSKSATELSDIKLISRNYSSISRDIFYVQTWQPPQKKIQKKLPIEAPPPVAPPIPFVLMGSIEKDNKVEYFIMHQNKLINLKLGETVNGQWRLDSEDARYLHWTYLPLNLTQVLLKQNFQTNVGISSNISSSP